MRLAKAKHQAPTHRLKLYVRAVIESEAYIPTYSFASPIDLKNVAKNLLVPNRLYKREHVESNALNAWELNIFNIIDNRVYFIASI